MLYNHVISHKLWHPLLLKIRPTAKWWIVVCQRTLIRWLGIATFFIPLRLGYGCVTGVCTHINSNAIIIFSIPIFVRFEFWVQWCTNISEHAPGEVYASAWVLRARCCRGLCCRCIPATVCPRVCDLSEIKEEARDEDGCNPKKSISRWGAYMVRGHRTYGDTKNEMKLLPWSNHRRISLTWVLRRASRQ